MVHRRSVAFVAMLGLLPFVLVACSKATSSADPRTQAPLVQVGTVEIIYAGGAFLHRYRRGPCAK
jgi:hypothetical protein